MTDPIIEMSFTLPLDQTVLCADCSRVYDIHRAACPSCTSQQAIPLSRVLGERTLTLVLDKGFKRGTQPPRKRRTA